MKFSHGRVSGQWLHCLQVRILKGVLPRPFYRRVNIFIDLLYGDDVAGLLNGSFASTNAGQFPVIFPAMDLVKDIIFDVVS